MSSDDAYASFLDKVNESPSASNTNPAAVTSTTKDDKMPSSPSISSKPARKHESLIANSSNIPATFKSIDDVFTSESDEPFAPFTLPYPHESLPDADGFAEAVGYDRAQVKEIGLQDFDGTNQYSNVIETVKQIATDSRVRCYNVNEGKSRVVFFLVGREAKNASAGEGSGGRLVGFATLGVYS